MVWTVMPPQQYIHPPHMPVLEKRLSWAELYKICGTHNALACQFFGKEKGSKTRYCFVFLPQDASLNTAKLRTHELAHCNGWPGNHPGGHLENISASQNFGWVWR